MKLTGEQRLEITKKVLQEAKKIVKDEIIEIGNYDIDTDIKTVIAYSDEYNTFAKALSYIVNYGIGDIEIEV